MKKRNLSAILIALAFGGVFFSLSANNITSSTFGSSNEIWGHYPCVDATYDTKGMKEFWISCSTHNVVFEKPSVANEQIIERTPFTQKQIDQLADNDQRLLNKTHEIISFENASDVDLIFSRRNNFANKEIISTDATDGSHSLKMTYKDGTFDFMIVKDYLDRVFKDPEVQAVSFDLKANYSRDLSYRLPGGAVSRYEGNGASGYGVTTEWKTFSWPRSAYEQITESNFKDFAFIYIGGTADSNYVLLDNIRSVKKAVNYYGFENDYISYSSGNTAYIRDGSSNQAVLAFIVQDATAMDISYDYNIKSEGNRSLRVHKPYTKKLQLALMGIKGIMDEDDIVSFDLYTTQTYNSNTGFAGIRTGAGNPLFSNATYQHKANRWVTYNFKLSDFVSSWTLLLEVVASTEADFYFDNIVVSDGGLNEYGFERDAISFHNNSTQDIVVSGHLDNNYGTYTNYPNQVLKITGNNTISYAGFSTVNKTEGEQSLTFSRNNNNGITKLALCYEAAKQLEEGGSLVFDLYSSKECNNTQIKNGLGESITTSSITQPSHEWITYHLTSDDVTDDGEFLQISGNVIGDFFIDNIRFSSPASKYYSNNKNIYVSEKNAPQVFKTTNNIDSIISLSISDGETERIIPENEYEISGEKAFTISSSYLLTLSNGPKVITVLSEENDVESSDIIYTELTKITDKSSLTINTTYGSGDYYSLTGYSNLYRIMYENKEVPFEVSGSSYLIPYASLIELLPTKNNTKESGTINLTILTMVDHVVTGFNQPISISLTGGSSLKNIPTYSGGGIVTHAYSSTSNYGNNLTYEEYFNLDKLTEYDNTGLDVIYLQSMHISSGDTSLPVGVRYLFDEAAKINKKVMVVDNALNKLGEQETSVFNRDITIGYQTYNFKTTDELDSFVQTRLAMLVSESACYGVTILDEPTYKQICGGFGEVISSCKRVLASLGKTNFYINCNLLPMTAGKTRLTGEGTSDTSVDESYYVTYLNKYVELIGNQLGYIQYDYYPITDSTKKCDGMRDYTIMMALVAANIAKNNGLDLQMVTQSFTYSGTGDRYLKEADFAWLNNFAMGFGCKHISYFVYQNRIASSTSGEGWYDTSEFLSREGDRNDTYYYMQGILNQIDNFASTVSAFDYEWSHIYANSVLSWILAPSIFSKASSSSYYPSSSSYGQLTSFSTDSKFAFVTGLKCKNDTSKCMYMVENIYDNYANEFLQTETLTFDKTYTYAVVYEGGTPRVINLNSNTLTLKLSVGHAAYVMVY